VSTLVLASQSPARLATLRAAGVEPVVVVSGVDEDQLGPLPPAELALQLAELKCAAVAAREDLPSAALVLGCDSVLELDGEALGKPLSADEATRRWRSMRGRSGVLLTGHSLRDTATGHVAVGSSRCTVPPGASLPARPWPVEPTTRNAAPTSSAWSASAVCGLAGPSHRNSGSTSP